MSPFRGSDDDLEQEVRAVEGLVRVRLRRANDDLHELETALAELRRELKRRRLAAAQLEEAGTSSSALA
jgi:hypothetical protein